MTDNYEPTRKEVWKEVYNGIKIDNEKRERLREGIKKVCNGIVDYVGGTWMTGTCGYIIPSAIRSLKEESAENQENVGTPVPFNMGCITGLCLGLAQIVLYLDFAFKDNHPEVLLIPASTNVASEIYEIIRKSYKNAERRVITKKNLEDRLAQRENEQH